MILHPVHPTRRRTAASFRLIVTALVLAVASVLASATTASAHVLPSSSVELTIGKTSVNAAVAIPLDDLAAASGIDLGEETAADVASHREAITAYLLKHFAPTTNQNAAWTVDVGTLSVDQAGDTTTTGLYNELTTTFVLTPPTGASVRSFNLGYTIVVNKEITHVVIVTVASDWAAGATASPYELGTIRLNTVTGTVSSLHVTLGSSNELRGFFSMVVLGVQHIQEGTDHQLFLLTLLLPAPLIAARRHWGGPTTAKKAIRRIGSITLAFTLGHSVTLALGALGLPAPTAVIEALIAVSILVAAAHAIRPLFSGKEALVAGGFGLIHGLAFSTTLRALDLTGSRLVLSLLGFNLGIEAMQLAVVALVLPPLVLLARAGKYRTLRIIASSITALAAVGWLTARLGLANPVADLADQLGTISIPAVTCLWLAALVATLRARRSARHQTESVRLRRSS